MTVKLEYNGGDAVHGQDYNARTSVVIPEDIVSTFVAWQPVDDSDLEWTERVDAAIGQSSGYTVSEWGGQHTGWISDNEPNRVEIGASEVSANFNDDNDNGIRDWDDTTATNDPDLVQVDFKYPDGTPNYEAALDFSGGYGPPFRLWTDASKSQLVFDGNWTSFAWDQLPGRVGPGHAKLYLEAGGPSYSPNDLLVRFERREWSNTDPFPGGYGSGEGRTTVVWDAPSVQIVASDADASEEGPEDGAFTISRTGDTRGSLTVYYWLGGAAQAPGAPAEDYTGPVADAEYSGYYKVTIPAGSSSVVVPVKPVDDLEFEDAETVVATLTGSPSYTAPAYDVGSSSSATATIADNEPRLKSLTVTDADHPSNTVTNTGSSYSHLNVFERISTGDAGITLSGVVTGSTTHTGVLYRIVGWDASPNAGLLQNGTNVTLTPGSDGNRDYVVEAGVDTNRNSVLDSFETTHRVDVHVVGVEIQLNNSPESDDDVVRQSYEGYGSDIPASNPVLEGQIRLINAEDLPTDVSATLGNPEDRVRFGPPEEIIPVNPNQPTTLPRDGTFRSFRIRGVGASTLINDTTVRVTADVLGLAGA